MKRLQKDPLPYLKPGPYPLYSVEFLDALGDKMTADIKKDESILSVRTWYIKHDIVQKHIWNFIDVSKKFKYAVDLCRQICADRVQQGTMDGRINPICLTKFHAFYDYDATSAIRKYKKALVKDQIDSAKEADMQVSGINLTLKIQDSST